MTKLLHGDCLEVMKTLPENSVDSMVTDPPAGISFMGKAWDDDKGGRKQWIAWMTEVMAESMRVMKPGAHGLVWAIPRTSHWTATALEDAGFQVRDVVTHLFGCLSDDTELLTNSGWKHYSDIEKQDRVVCYDIERDTYQWGNIEDTFVYDYKDTAYRIYSDNTDQIVSKNHRCIVERGGGKSFQFAETLKPQESVPILEDVQGVLKALRCNDQGTGHKKQVLQHGVSREETKPGPYWGEEKARCNLFSMQSRVLDKLDGTSKSKNLRVQMSRHTSVKQWASRTLESYFSSWSVGRQHSRKPEEERDAWLEEPSLERRGNFQEKQRELYRAEVCKVPEGIYGNVSERRVCNGTSTSGSTTFEKMPNSNRSCTPHKPQNKRQSGSELNAIQEQYRPQEVRGSRFTRTDMVRVEPIEYIGKVWCIKVPTGAFVARRKGKVFVTGNSGFPKSQNIGKAIDKAAGAEREKGESVGSAPNIKNNNFNNSEGRGRLELTNDKPATPEAKQWDGWGTALKPASEHWILIRKPLAEKTIAKNVLKHGTGGINIDACRVEGKKRSPEFKKPDSKGQFGQTDNSNLVGWDNTQGRFPANLILDEKAGELLDGQSGILKGDRSKSANVGGLGDTGGASRFFKTFGGESCQTNNSILASNAAQPCGIGQAIEQIGRILFAPENVVQTLDLVNRSLTVQSVGKNADSTETHIVQKLVQIMRGPSRGSRVYLGYISGQKQLIHDLSLALSVGTMGNTDTTRTTQNPRKLYGFASLVIDACTTLVKRDTSLKLHPLRFGYFSKASKKDKGATNNHPTVKNSKLMEYLIKLVTPENGIVLDPFMGSGSTGVACNNLNREFIGIEKEEEYYRIAQERILLSDLF